jgi:hypothetical protein
MLRRTENAKRMLIETNQEYVVMVVMVVVVVAVLAAMVIVAVITAMAMVKMIGARSGGATVAKGEEEIRLMEVIIRIEAV